MQEAFDASIRPKLDAIDKVRHHLTEVDIELPAIVVVGDQSSGKSSVLESLSGIGLPRGGNLVTRCPLELALRRGPTESAVLSYTDPNDGSKEISNPIQLAEIPDAVNAATRHLAGDNSGTCAHQPEGESKVILCVLPATADFATQEAIKISRHVDPSGKRTVGVVTKVDLAEPGIKDRLEATGPDHLRLQLGYVAVRSRTGQELKDGVSSVQARDKEAELFRTHPELKLVAQEYKGVPALSRKLVQIQAERIQSHLPELQKQVNNKLRAAEGETRKMQGVISTEAEAEKCLSGLLERMHRRVTGLVQAAPEVADHRDKELHVAPRVYAMLENYKSEVWEAIGGKEYFRSIACHDMLKEHSEEVRGATLPNFVGDRVFNGIFAEQVYSSLKPSAKGLVQIVHKYMADVLWKLTGSTFAAFPRLQTAIKALIQEELDQLAQEATANAMNVIKSEKYVFTNNNAYMKLLNKKKECVMRKQNGHTDEDADARDAKDEDLANLDVLDVGSGNNEQALVDLQLSLAAYTQVVITNLCDSIPKLVRAQLVGKVAKSLSSIIRDGLKL
ncbi:TPA: hypothetical protein ACH3X3_012722 [Trebouxia sp. C0006]